MGMTPLRRNEQKVLTVKNLTVRIPNGAETVEVLKGVELALGQGEIVGLVGESGAGKSVLARTLVRLEAPAVVSSGKILLNGEDIVRMKQREIAGLRGEGIAMVPQNPMSAMDPLFSMKAQFREVFRARINGNGNNGFRRQKSHFLEKTESFLRAVGIASPRERCRQYPHQWSRGMLQRGQLVMAFLSRPSVLVLDEVTSALDPTVCLQILDAVARLREEYGTAILMITHDLFLAAEVCDRLAVISSGRIVETGPVRDIFERPAHPYTRKLVSATLDRKGA
jgi:ABC-type dipeptide/oligopeptide/nickel transport system ATPase component